MDWSDFEGRSQNILSLAVIVFDLMHFVVGWIGTIWGWALTVQIVIGFGSILNNECDTLFCVLERGSISRVEDVVEDFFGEGCYKIEALFESRDGLHERGFKVAGNQ